VFSHLEGPVLTARREEVPDTAIPRNDVDVVLVRIDGNLRSGLATRVPDTHGVVGRRAAEHGALGGAPLDVFHATRVARERLGVHLPAAAGTVPHVDGTRAVPRTEAPRDGGRPVDGVSLGPVAAERKRGLGGCHDARAFGHHAAQTVGKVEDVHLTRVGHGGHDPGVLRHAADAVHATRVTRARVLNGRVLVHLVVVVIVVLVVHPSLGLLHVTQLQERHLVAVGTVGLGPRHGEHGQWKLSVGGRGIRVRETPTCRLGGGGEECVPAGGSRPGCPAQCRTTSTAIPPPTSGT